MPFTAAQPVELLARIQVIECPGDEKPDGDAARILRRVRKFFADKEE